MKPGLELSDLALDGPLPDRFRRRSSLFWTPLEIVQRGVGWLDEVAAGDVLDLGSGVGKWCVGAALSDRDGRRRYLGLEHRADLVATATALAAHFEVSERVAFHCGEVADLAPSSEKIGGPFDPAGVAAFYLFNPFGENTAPEHEYLDTAVELSEARFRRDVAATEALLRAARPGTLALIYNGFGGRVPDSYEVLRSDYERPFTLRLWRKR